MIKHIIFDCDGVIVDSEILASRIAVHMLAPRGYPLNVEEHTRRFSGFKEKEILAAIKSEYQTDIPHNFMDEFAALLRKAFVEELEAIEGMVELIKGLSLPRSVVSNSFAEDVIRNTQKVGVFDQFEGRIFSAEEVANPKPAPDLYLMAIEKIGLDREEILVVEDSLPGMTAAKSAGLFTIGFLGASHIFEGHEEKLLEAGADEMAQDATALKEIFDQLLFSGHS